MPLEKSERVEWPFPRREPNGLGVLCAEAQADGVPCPDVNCDCEHCSRAYVHVDPAAVIPDRKRAHA